MKRMFLFFGLSALMVPSMAIGQSNFQRDTLPTSNGNLEITFIGHGTLMFQWKNKVIHVDPWTKLADYSKLPKADIILLTHDHRDHLDQKALESIRTDKTSLVITKICAQTVKGGIIMENGNVKDIQGLKVEAVPAYNLVHMRSPGNPYHPEGDGNGYIISIGDKRVYVAGDTENTPEMKALKNIDVAFLPMNLPYTMTPDMVADAARSFRPKILYPYHYGDTDLSVLQNLLKDEKGVELRIRKMH